MLFWDDWDELLKAHKYSRKEFVNGVMRYYYDKNDNFSRMTRCAAEPLAVSEAMAEKQIVRIAQNYLKNVWVADWKQHPEKAIVKELRGKQVKFSNISYEHIEKTGGHSSKGRGERSKENLLSHVKYLPLAKELLEENGVHTQSRYEELKRKTKDGAVAFVYQTVSGLAPEGDANNYVHVTVSQKKYADGHLGNTIYISVMGAKDIKKAVPQTVAFSLRIGDITEGNRQAKFEELQKCLDGETPRYIADDGTRRLGSAELALKDLSAARVNKALRTMALSLDVPTKAGKGEAFAFKAQEDLSDKWAAVFASLVREAYDFVTGQLSLPQVTVMSKAYLTHKGKILYSPETGEPISQAEWNRFVKNLEDFLNRKTQGLGERIVLEGEALGAILDRMLKYNTLEAVKNARLEGLKYHGKAFDWIADDVKNLKNVLGEALTRREAARVQAVQMSAAQRITKMTGEMKEDVKQILVDGVKKRQGASQVSQALFDRFVGLNSNFQRIAETEIQNAVGGAIVREEVHNAKEGEKVYFQRVEIVDGNTCPYCKRMEGKIAVWSDVPLANERVKDPHADFAIWEGKEWTGGKHIAAVGCFHPYCRGFWTRWTPEGRAADAYVAEIFKRGAKWKEAVETAKKEYKEKGIESPDDRTAGYRERIEELFAGDEVKKAFDESKCRRGKDGKFISKEAAEEEKRPQEQEKKEKVAKRVSLDVVLAQIKERRTPEEKANIERIIAETDWLKETTPNGKIVYIAPKRSRKRSKEKDPELSHAAVFADRGYNVYLLEEDQSKHKVKSYDAIINGLPVEFKYIKNRAKAVEKRVHEGLEQAKTVSLYISKDVQDDKALCVKKLIQAGKETQKEVAAVIIYFQDDDSLAAFEFPEMEEKDEIGKGALLRAPFLAARAETATLEECGSTSPTWRAPDKQAACMKGLPPNKDTIICKACIVNKNLKILEEFLVEV